MSQAYTLSTMAGQRCARGGGELRGLVTCLLPPNLQLLSNFPVGQKATSQHLCFCREQHSTAGLCSLGAAVNMPIAKKTQLKAEWKIKEPLPSKQTSSTHTPCAYVTITPYGELLFVPLYRL